VNHHDPTWSGILLVNKPEGRTAFSLVRQLRRLTGQERIGHAGTLDPFATGVMVMLIGRPYTRLSGEFLNQDKEYVTTLHLGQETDTYDREGRIIAESDRVPSEAEVVAALQGFQGWTSQLPPMYSAKKIQGKKLYDLARRGQVIERTAATVHMQLELLAYDYPRLQLRVVCSKGTYVRSLAHDIGEKLHCYGHLEALQRSRSGPFRVEQCVNGQLLWTEKPDVRTRLIRCMPQ
jgi:tRNA pseudouridine55 synthase